MSQKIQIAPSSFPYLRNCPCFEPNRAKSERTTKQKTGELVDSAFRHAANSPKATAKDIVKEAPEMHLSDASGVEWAKEVMQRFAGNKEVITERRLCAFSFNHSSGVLIKGEMDGFCKGHIFELKSGNVKPFYRHQLLPYAAYMLSVNPDLDKVEGHLVFTKHRSWHRIEFYRKRTFNRLDAFVNNFLNPKKKPVRSSTTCQRCKHFNGGKCYYVSPIQSL